MMPRLINHKFNNIGDEPCYPAWNEMFQRWSGKFKHLTDPTLFDPVSRLSYVRDGWSPPEHMIRMMGACKFIKPEECVARDATMGDIRGVVAFIVDDSLLAL